MIDDSRRHYPRVQTLLPFVLFLGLAGNGIFGFFGGDDLMNLFTYSSHPLSHWVMGVVKFWSSAWYRPLGGVVYLVLFQSFGFHPLPFKLLLFAALLLNMAVYLRTAGRISGSVQIASWALLFCSYHAALNGLYLNFGTIFDVAGYSCYWGALLGYVAWVSSRKRRIAGLVAIILLYIAGLCFKEMGVTLPAVLLAYNLLLTDAPKSERWRWPVQSGLPVLLCSGLAVLYTYGKLTGPDTLANQAQYAPHFTLHQYAAITAHYIRELFHLPGKLPTPTGALWIMAAMIAVAVGLRSRLLIFCALSIVLTQLPISFMSPRGAFVIYIPFAFWALYAAALIHRVTPSFRMPGVTFACYLIVAAGFTLVQLQMKRLYDPNFTVQATEYKTFSQRLDKWDVRLQPQGRVLLVNDPFRADWIGWDPMFLLNVRSHTTQAVVNRMKFATNVPPLTEIDWYDYVIDYDTGWRLLKASGKSPVATARLREISATASVLLLDGFQPPTQPGWRLVAPEFTIRTRAGEPGAHQLAVSLSVNIPARLSVRLDEREAVDDGVHGPGNIDLAVPIPPDTAGEMHKLSFRVEDGSGRGNASPPQVLFVNAQLQARGEASR